LTKEIPVIFLTAKTDTDSIVKGFEFGAADYVIKPFNSAELLARVSTHLLLKKSREALKNANQQLQELNATKDKFFSIIAHDLRNPFNALIGGSSFLMDSFENLDKEQIRYFIGEMNAAAKNTLNLLENLLAWSRSQTGRMQCSPRRISISDIVSETVELLKNNAEEKELSLLNDVEPENFVYADAEMTKTVVRNLVSNAVKYTAKGGTVKIASKETEAFTEISISDTGIGITEQRMETLFKIDFPHSAKGTAGEQGTGLGLLLCKEFLEKNRGEIEAKSRPGEGSVFSIRLPKEASDETAQITFS
jgi:signal transduction histidine kinase